MQMKFIFTVHRGTTSTKNRNFSQHLNEKIFPKFVEKYIFDLVLEMLGISAWSEVPFFMSSVFSLFSAPQKCSTPKTITTNDHEKKYILATSVWCKHNLSILGHFRNNFPQFSLQQKYWKKLTWFNFFKSWNYWYFRNFSHVFL